MDGCSTQRYKAGMLAKSKAGHDTGKVYVIIEVDDTYVYLADGNIRTLGHLKKKRGSMYRLSAENMILPGQMM